jgi:hypothetical protein
LVAMPPLMMSPPASTAKVDNKPARVLALDQ